MSFSINSFGVLFYKLFVASESLWRHKIKADTAFIGFIDLFLGHEVVDQTFQRMKNPYTIWNISHINQPLQCRIRHDVNCNSAVRKVAEVRQVSMPNTAWCQLQCSIHHRCQVRSSGVSMPNTAWCQLQLLHFPDWTFRSLAFQCRIRHDVNCNEWLVFLTSWTTEWFQCRIRHDVNCNYIETLIDKKVSVSMPNTAWCQLQ